MLAVHVHCRIKPQDVDAFQAASLENARASLAEPGVLRFDVLQQVGAPETFVLVEVYRTPEDPARHKETPHYAVWRDSVAPMMAETRTSVRFEPLFPQGEGAWDTPPGALGSVG